MTAQEINRLADKAHELSFDIIYARQDLAKMATALRDYGKVLDAKERDERNAR